MLIAAACSSGSGERAGQPDQKPAEAKAVSLATSDTAPRLSLSAPLTLHADGGLNPTVAIDRGSEAVYLAWAREVPAAGEGNSSDPLLQAVVARSDDGGKTFGEPVVASAPTDRVVSYTVSPTQVVVGPKGEVFVLYLRSDPDFGPQFEYGRSFLHLVRSEDGGKTFSPPVVVGSESVEGTVTSMEMADLFVAPNGDLYVSWLDFREEYAAKLAAQGKPAEEKSGHGAEEEEPPTQLRVARSTDGGRTFAPSTLVSKPTCQCCGTKVAQGREGPLFATTRSDWKELKGSKDAVRDPFLSVSTDAGATWSEARKIHDDGFKISGCPDISAGLAVDRRGRLHAAWYTGTEQAPGPGVYYAVSEDRGQTFSDPVALLVDAWVPYGDVKLSLDDADHAWVAFEDRRGDEDAIRLVRLAPDGSVEVSEAWPGTAPDVSAGAGSAVVTWAALPPKAQDGDHDKTGAIRALVAASTAS